MNKVSLRFEDILLEFFKSLLFNNFTFFSNKNKIWSKIKLSPFRIQQKSITEITFIYFLCVMLCPWLIVNICVVK